MISRIQIKAFGASAAEVETSLRHAASAIDLQLHLEASYGEQVIERNLTEPDDCRLAFEGRLVLHPNTAEDAAQIRIASSATMTMNYDFGGATGEPLQRGTV